VKIVTSLYNSPSKENKNPIKFNHSGIISESFFWKTSAKINKDADAATVENTSVDASRVLILAISSSVVNFSSSSSRLGVVNK